MDARSKQVTEPRGHGEAAKRKRRSARIEARITPENLMVIRRAAEIQGRSISDFVVEAAREAAYQEIERTHVIQVSIKDYEMARDMIQNPPEPTDALRRAADSYRRMIKSADD